MVVSRVFRTHFKLSTCCGIRAVILVSKTKNTPLAVPLLRQAVGHSYDGKALLTCADSNSASPKGMDGGGFIRLYVEDFMHAGDLQKFAYHLAEVSEL
jgi:hypothetical protein